jgi:hypothetical protein
VFHLQTLHSVLSHCHRIHPPCTVIGSSHTWNLTQLWILGVTFWPWCPRSIPSRPTLLSYTIEIYIHLQCPMHWYKWSPSSIVNAPQRCLISSVYNQRMKSAKLQLRSQKTIDLKLAWLI